MYRLHAHLHFDLTGAKFCNQRQRGSIHKNTYEIELQSHLQAYLSRTKSKILGEVYRLGPGTRKSFRGKPTSSGKIQ